MSVCFGSTHARGVVKTLKPGKFGFVNVRRAVDGPDPAEDGAAGTTLRPVTAPPRSVALCAVSSPSVWSSSTMTA